MGKKKGDKAEGEEKKRNGEGKVLLGSPTFKELENGRYRCVETGHELPVHARDSYAQSKHCRLGLINAALARNKPPLNIFRQDPQSASKLICKLTGDIINKNEEHIWKHINGKRFRNVLEKKELEQETSNGTETNKSERKSEKKTKTKPDSSRKKKEQQVEENGGISVSEVVESSELETGAEEEPDFWMPPEGDRWDNDDGGDRWGSDTESGAEDGNNHENDGEPNVVHDEELSTRTKRMSLEIGPSSFATRKKKKKTTQCCMTSIL